MSQASVTSSQEARIAATEAAMEAALEASWASGSGSPVVARPATVLDSPSTPEELLVWEPKRNWQKRHAPGDTLCVPDCAKDNTQDFGEVKVLWINSVPFVHSSKTNFIYCGTAVMSRDGRGIDSYVECFTCSCIGMHGHEEKCKCECHLLKQYYMSYSNARNAKACRIGPLELPTQIEDSQVLAE